MVGRVTRSSRGLPAANTSQVGTREAAMSESDAFRIDALKHQHSECSAECIADLSLCSVDLPLCSGNLELTRVQMSLKDKCS